MQTDEFSNLKHLEIILKTVERCNLNCSYCYFFNGSDTSFKKHPPFIKKETLQNTIHFLQQACKDFPLEKIVIDIHGGEPLLQKKSDFDEMCTLFRTSLPSNIQLRLKIQTNGTLITPDWLELFQKHNIYPGVSIDGDREAHDKFRVDHKGKGSYDAVKKGIDLLRQAHEQKKIPNWGILCVINPTYSAKKLFNHFVDELGIQGMDFLLPDTTHDTFKNHPHTADDYGQFLCDLLEAWTTRDDPSIKVRILESTLRSFLGGSHMMLGLNNKTKESLAITISSNGELSPNDALRTAVPEHMSIANAANTSLKDLLAISSYKTLRRAIEQLPTQCTTCCWSRICGGGFANNRFSRQNGFNNPSIYCSGLKTWYQKIANYLIQNGFTYEEIKQKVIHAQ